MKNTSVKLAISITILIVMIEAVMLIFSLNTKEIQLNKLRDVEYSHYNNNLIYTQEYIETEVEKFKRSIVLLTILICCYVSIGSILIYHHQVGRYLNSLTRMAGEVDPKKLRDGFSKVPKNDIGRLILSRVSVLEKLHVQNESNRKLIRILIHDLNNTIAIIDGNTRVLLKRLEKAPNLVFEKSVLQIQKGAKSQKDLVDKVRQIEALKSDKVEQLIEDVVFQNSFDDCHLTFESKLEKKSLKLVCTNQDSNRFFLKADKVLFLNNVLNNLVSNAIKFSKEGSEISIVSYTKDGKRILEIRDEGIGIPKIIIDNLFDSYTKTTRLGTEGEEGTGFGMPLVKEAISDWGGTIEVQSKELHEYPEDHGTVFVLSIPA